MKTALDCPKSTVKISPLSRAVKFVLVPKEAERDTFWDLTNMYWSVMEIRISRI